MATGKLAKKDQWEELPITYQTTTGEIGSGGYIKIEKRKGFLFFNLYNAKRAATTNVGSNMYAATIQGTPEFSSGMFCTYSGSSVIVVALWNDGNNTAHVECRVIGANLAANSLITARGFLRTPD